MLQLVFIADCQQHPIVYGRRPSFSGRRCLCWNNLSEHVPAASSVAVFRSRLKNHLFNISYLSLLWLYSACAVTKSRCFRHCSLIVFVYLSFRFTALTFSQVTNDLERVVSLSILLRNLGRSPHRWRILVQCTKKCQVSRHILQIVVNMLIPKSS